jgi:hypothetical protein
MVACPETRMERILAQIHYIPDQWKGNAHTYKVRDEFAQLYQYKCVSGYFFQQCQNQWKWLYVKYLVKTCFSCSLLIDFSVFHIYIYVLALKQH